MAITGLESSHSLRPQFATLNNYSSQTLKHLPYAYTEQGVAMLSGILNRDRAININIAIMRAFVETRRIGLQQMNIREQLKQIKDRLGEHDSQLNQIYDAPRNNRGKWKPA